MIVPLHSSLGDRVRSSLKKEKKDGDRERRKEGRKEGGREGRRCLDVLISRNSQEWLMPVIPAL